MLLNRKKVNDQLRLAAGEKNQIYGEISELLRGEFFHISALHSRYNSSTFFRAHGVRRKNFRLD